MEKPLNTHSFLIRIQHALGEEDDWTGEIKHVQEGEHRRFTTLDEMLLFLCDHAALSRVSSSPKLLRDDTRSTGKRN